MVKTAGVAEVLRESLTLLEERIATAFIFGSFAKGTEMTSEVMSGPEQCRIKKRRR